MKVLLGIIILAISFPLIVKELLTEKQMIPKHFQLEIKRYLGQSKNGSLGFVQGSTNESGDPGKKSIAGQSVRRPEGSNGSRSQGFLSQRKIPIIEINGADSLVLQLLPGIGPAFASRIVRFRDRLGGFWEKGQLMEIYGMDSIRYSGLKDFVRLDTSLISRLMINEMDAERLGRHPMIGYKLGKLFVRYRELHGPFKNEKDLKKLGVMDEETIRKLSKYLDF